MSGPGFDAEPWDPNTVVETVVGQATITFTDGNHATFEYTVNGVTQTKQIERQVFAGGGTVCAVPDQSAAYVASFVDLANRANAGTITGEQFVVELAAHVAEIESADGALQRLKVYLEAEVVGRALDFTLPAAVKGRLGNRALDAALADEIVDSLTFELVLAAVAGAEFLLSPDPAGNFIQARDIPKLLALAAVVTRIETLDAQASGAITPQVADAILDFVTDNAYEGLRQYYLATGQAVPAWLLPAPTACLTKCIDRILKLAGSGTGEAILEVAAPPPYPYNCRMSVGFDGSFNVDLTIRPDNTVNGTVGVTGTAKVLETDYPFCPKTTLPINATAPITGSIVRMTAALVVATYPALLVMEFVNEILLGQVQRNPGGQLLMSFSLTKVP